MFAHASSMSLGCQTRHNAETDLHIELLRRVISRLLASLCGTNRITIPATLIEPRDLISFSRGLGGHTPPVQVSAGRLSGIVMRVDLGPIEIMYEFCNQDLVFDDDEHLVGACIYREEQCLKVHLPGERGLIPRPANSHAVYLLCKATNEELEPHGQGECIRTLSSVTADAFWRGVDQTLRIIAKDYTRSDVDEKVSLPTQTIISILTGFRSALAAHESSGMDPRDKVLGQFYALAKRHAFANIEDIARSLAMTRRNLHYYASSRLGIAPKRLIKSMALRNVMCRLPTSAPPTNSIADIAFENGFESPAQFSMDYRRHFGERPSETRRRYQ